MIEHRINGADAWAEATSRAFYKDHAYPQSARRRNLAIARGTPTIFRNHRINRVCAEQSKVMLDSERSSVEQIVNARHDQGRLNRFYRPDQIMMLRRGIGNMRLLPAQRQEHSAWGVAKRHNCATRIGYLYPPVAALPHPFGAQQSDEWNIRDGRRFIGVIRDIDRERMRRINQDVGIIGPQIIDKPRDAAKSTAANWYGHSNGCHSAPSEREQNRNTGILRQTPSQQARLSSSAQYKDALHGKQP